MFVLLLWCRCRLVVRELGVCLMVVWYVDEL